MDIDQQIQALIDDAPQDGRTPAAIEAIAPVLKGIAAQLKHPQYYVLQNLQQQWVVTTLNHLNQAGVNKQVIYAFPSLKDVSSDAQSLKDPDILAIPVPVTHILFQLIAMQTVDSLVFFEVPGNASTALEVTRQNFQDLIKLQLQGTQKASIPPDIA
jgi:hypothetical protein